MYIYTWNSKQPVFYGCFNWMIPNLYIKNGCSTKHPLKNGCLVYQVYIYIYIQSYVYMAFCAFETHKAPNISEKHPSVIIDCCLFLSQKTSQLPKGNCFKFVQTKNWSMVSPYAAFATFPKKKIQNLNVSGIWGHIPHYFTAHFKKLDPPARKERRLPQIANPPVASPATPGFSLRSQFRRTQLLQDFAQFGTRCGTLFRLLAGARSKPPDR